MAELAAGEWRSPAGAVLVWPLSWGSACSGGGEEGACALGGARVWVVRGPMPVAQAMGLGPVTARGPGIRVALGLAARGCVGEIRSGRSRSVPNKSCIQVTMTICTIRKVATGERLWSGNRGRSR